MTKRKLSIKPEQGKTSGYTSPKEVNTVYNNLLIAQRDTEKWIAEQFAGIDLNDKSKENIARINQRKLIVKDRWNEHNGKTFVNRPKSVNHLTKTVRGRHTWSSRGLQIGTAIPSLLSQGKLVDTSERLMGANNPYDFIEKAYKFQTKIEGVTRTRLGKDINWRSLTDLGMTLHQPTNKEASVYFDSSLDRTNTTKDLTEARKARLSYKSKSPSQYAANPGGYLYNLNENNQFFAAAPAEAGSPYNPNRRRSNYGDDKYADIRIGLPGQKKAPTAIQRRLLDAGFDADNLSQLMVDHEAWKAARR